VTTGWLLQVGEGLEPFVMEKPLGSSESSGKTSNQRKDERAVLISADDPRLKWVVIKEEEHLKDLEGAMLSLLYPLIVRVELPSRPCHPGLWLRTAAPGLVEH
jgi:hypothetical protein